MHLLVLSKLRQFRIRVTGSTNFN